MQLRFYRDEPSSERLYVQFDHDDVLARLQAVDIRARRKGLQSLDSAKNPLISLGMEFDASGRVTKNSYGVFNLAWQAAEHPEWAQQMEDELQASAPPSARPTAVPTALPHLGRHGRLGRGQVDVQRRRPAQTRPALLRPRFHRSRQAKAILEDMERRHALDTAILKRTLVVGMAMGMTSYEPVVNLEKLATLYDYHDRLPPQLRLHDAARFAARSFRLASADIAASNCSSTAPTPPPAATAVRSPAAASIRWACPHRPSRLDGRPSLSTANVQTAWRLACFLHAQGEAGRDKVTLMLAKAWAGAAVWTKQDFEESLGKSEEIGIKIISCERLRSRNYRSPRDARRIGRSSPFG